MGRLVPPPCILLYPYYSRKDGIIMASMLLQATLDTDAYLKRLAFLFTGSFCLLGGPIAYQTFDPLRQVQRTSHFFPTAAGMEKTGLLMHHPEAR